MRLVSRRTARRLAWVSWLLIAPLTFADTYVPVAVTPPKIMREMRAVWIASVGNIDWPSTNGLSVAQQKAEFLAMLDRAVELKLNTIIFQVRPACDALYSSKLEPWSEYLTGTMGKPPEPLYDPLAFAISEAHRRGLELHAWFNPFRARHLQAKSPISPNHISRTHPEWVRRYGKSLWLDPGEKAVQGYSLNVVNDVVKRYDIDGVHFDDYFYPYAEQDATGRDVDFPDEMSWRRFGAGTRLSRADWRRQNIDLFVRQVYRSIKTAKPWVKFGISPFGIWRPGYPAQIKGFDAFGGIYADSRKWLANGWVDYLAPQLYWGISPPETSFPVLLDWWARQNTQHRLLCPGLKSYNVGRSWPVEEIINQIQITRSQAGASGHVHWDLKTLMRNGALDTALERQVYGELALVPPVGWLQHVPPAKPSLGVSRENGQLRVAWTCPNSDQVRLWVLQIQTAGRWATQILAQSDQSRLWNQPVPEVIAVTAVDRYGNVSLPAGLELTHMSEASAVSSRK